MDLVVSFDVSALNQGGTPARISILGETHFFHGRLTNIHRVGEDDHWIFPND